jgi:SAM-dependent methyltransferase
MAAAQQPEMRYDFMNMNAESPVLSRASSLRLWYKRPLGRLLSEVELAALEQQLPTLFGYHLMVIDPPWENCCLNNSRIPHQVIQHIGSEPQDGVVLQGDTEAWPVMTDSVDAVILPHTLELAREPHQVLREADRSLIPDGHLLILGFNPRSLWGLRRVLTPRARQMPWESRFLSMHRIKDWISLLGFDVLYSSFLFHRPPLQNTRLLEKLHFMEPSAGKGRMLLAGVYLLVARKRSIIMTPIKPAWEKKRRILPVGIPTSSQRNIRRAS